MNALCDVINLGIYAIACFSAFVLGGVTVAMLITQSPHLFRKGKPGGTGPH